MNEHLEQILHDIYELDPTLKERDGEVRSIITSLKASKPEIAIRPDFITELRATLLAQPVPVVPARPILGLPWFMLYVAPVGVAALLIFMLLPAQTTSLPPGITVPVPVPDTGRAKTLPTENPEARIMKPETADTTMVVPDPAPATSPSDSFSTMVVPEGDARMMDESTLMLPSVPEEPVISLESSTRFEPFRVVVRSMEGAAGFLVVEEIRQETRVSGKVIAVSPYLQASFAMPLTLSLREELVAGASYRVALYHDNEASARDRGSFNPTTDTVVFEQAFMVATDGSLIVSP